MLMAKEGYMSNYNIIGKNYSYIIILMITLFFSYVTVVSNYGAAVT